MTDIVKLAFFNFRSNKKLVFQLAKIYGLKILSAQQLLIKLQIPRDIKVLELTDVQFNLLEQILKTQSVELSRKLHIHTTLKTQVKLNILTYKKMNPAFYIASRWKYGLPVHGQRTRSTGRRNKKLVLAKK